MKTSDIKHLIGWRAAHEPNLKHITVQMYLTRRCNYQCSYCTHHDNTEEFKSFEEYKTLMDLIYRSVGDRDVLDISFFGGEPTIVPCFVQIVDYILDTYPNTYITLTSNGSMPLSFWQQLKRHSGRIHCFMSYQHNSTRDLDEFIRKMEWLHENDFLYFLSIMLENENENQIKDAIRLFKTSSIRDKLTYASIDFNFNPAYEDIKHLFGSLDYTVIDDQEYALKATLLDDSVVYFNDHMQFKTLDLHHFKYFRCYVGRDHILLDSNGDVYYCFSHILSDKAPLGNVYTDENILRDLANSNGTICTFDECVSDIWIEKDRIMGLRNEKG